MKKILFLNAYSFPEKISSPYLEDNLEEAIMGKYGIVSYCPSPSRGVDKEIREKYKHLKLESLNGGRKTIHRFGLMREGRNPMIRAIRYTLCVVIQFFKALFAKDARECDLIYISSTPPIKGIMVSLVKKIRRIPFIYNLQDIFPDSLVGAGMTQKGSLLWKIGRYIENTTYRNADKIIVISEDFKRNIMAKGVPPEKIEVIYNWVDESMVFPVKKEDNRLMEELGIRKDSFKVVYAGNLGNAQNIKILLEAASNLLSISSIDFLIFGSGGNEAEYKNYVQEHNLSNVYFYPLQPLNRVAEVYSMADVSLVSCKKGFGGSAMPSKTWNILATGTPILCSFDKGGELERMIETYDFGLFSDADDVYGLEQNIKRLYEDRSLCLQMGENGRTYVMQNMTKKIGMAKYLKVIDEVLEKTNNC